jgi:hypothetical protein
MYAERNLPKDLRRVKKPKPNSSSIAFGSDQK